MFCFVLCLLNKLFISTLFQFPQNSNSESHDFILIQQSLWDTTINVPLYIKPALFPSFSS